jgi:hypothetical protein
VIDGRSSWRDWPKDRPVKPLLRHPLMECRIKEGGLSILEWDGPTLWSSASTARGTPSFNMTTLVRRSIRDLEAECQMGNNKPLEGLIRTWHNSQQPNPNDWNL